ncbi:MAG: macro domain-containing protein [Myxococcota bacterium]|nr:macro domain-containing protein [Myxococcota bacterium]
MFTYKTGNILTENVEAIVNTVNCVGVMGRGIALQFKKSYPNNFKAYAAACKNEEVQPGKMFVFETQSLTNPRYIINFPTKRHWKGKSRMEDIEAGLAGLVEVIRTRGIRSIAIPPLGSGLGGLSWPGVKQRIEAALSDLDDVQIVIFEPGKARPDERINRSKDVPNMTAGRAALVELMDRYLKGLLDPFVTLLEVHKLMYFMQVSGQPLDLNYTKGIYGPYAENLRHVLNAIEGHFVTGYEDGGDAPGKQLSLVPGALKDARTFLEKDENTRKHLQRVYELVEGFESPFGLELLATVHWIAEEEHLTSTDDIAKRVYVWNSRKKQFTKRQIEIAYKVLKRNGWFD